MMPEITTKLLLFAALVLATSCVGVRENCDGRLTSNGDYELIPSDEVPIEGSVVVADGEVTITYENAEGEVIRVRYARTAPE